MGRLHGRPVGRPGDPAGQRGDGLIMAARGGRQARQPRQGDLDPVAATSARSTTGSRTCAGGLGGQLPGEIMVNRDGSAVRQRDAELQRHRPRRSRTSTRRPTSSTTTRASRSATRRARAALLALNAGCAAATTATAGSRPTRCANWPRSSGSTPTGSSSRSRNSTQTPASGSDPVFHRGEKPWEVHFAARERLAEPIAQTARRRRRSSAIGCGPAVFGTRGGPVINENAQIVDFDNQPDSRASTGRATSSPTRSPRPTPAAAGRSGPASRSATSPASRSSQPTNSATCLVSWRATTVNGSRLCSARLSTTAPSVAAIKRVANAAASRLRRPPTCSSSAKCARHPRKTFAASASRSLESVATVTARIEHPAPKFDRVSRSRHRARKCAVSDWGGRAAGALHQLGGPAARAGQGGGHQLVLAIREVVIDRAARRSGQCEDF